MCKDFQGFVVMPLLLIERSRVPNIFRMTIPIQVKVAIVQVKNSRNQTFERLGVITAASNPRQINVL